MLRRPLLALAALVAALVAVPAAAAAVVHVRVEGRSLTIFGGNEPAEVASTPLDALETAARVGEFYVHVASTSFGEYVDQIGYYPAAGDSGWVFTLNGASPPDGADKVQLKDGDTVEWYWATFGADGSGPPTLRLTRVKSEPRCYRDVQQDDAGAVTAALGAVLHVDGRTLPTQGSTGAAMACVAGRRHGLVYATKPGTVRSNRLP